MALIERAMVKKISWLVIFLYLFCGLRLYSQLRWVSDANWNDPGARNIAIGNQFDVDADAATSLYPSITLLSNFLAKNVQVNDVRCNSLTLQENVTQYVDIPPYILAATGSLDSALLAPPSLFQFAELQRLPGVSIIPRPDLYQIMRNDGSKSGMTQGYNNRREGGPVSFHSRTTNGNDEAADMEWFLSYLHNNPNMDPQGLQNYTAKALNCTLLNSNGKYSCGFNPKVKRTNGIASIKLPNFAAEMYQNPKSTLDPVVPSVAVFHEVYAEALNSRVLIQTNKLCNASQNDESTANETKPSIPTNTIKKQYLIQFNQCVVDSKKMRIRDKPFAFPESKFIAKFDAAVLITAGWSGEFYHATVEQLPRLLLLLDFLKDHPDVPIIMAERPSPKLLSVYSKLFGLDPKRFIAYNSWQEWKTIVLYAKTLYIPEPSPCLRSQPLPIRATRDAIQQALLPFQKTIAENKTSDNKTSIAPSANVADDDIIIVIRRQKTRVVQNHDDMMTALKVALPNETWYVFDEGGSLPDIGIGQWSVFARAKMVIAPHGAGLSHLLACRSGTSVVEFLPDKFEFYMLSFLHLAYNLNLDYHLLRMELVQQQEFKVDIAQIVGVVEGIIAEREETKNAKIN